MIPPGARVWIALGHTDMRKGMQGLALLVQQGLPSSSTKTFPFAPASRQRRSIRNVSSPMQSVAAAAAYFSASPSSLLCS